MTRFVPLALLILALVSLQISAQTLADTTQILVNWSPEQGHIFKLSFKEPTRYDAWRIEFGDGAEALIAEPSAPATHFYREAGEYVAVVTIYLADQKPVQIQKSISIMPLGSPMDRALANARKFAIEVGAALLAIFLLLREIGVIA